jgi:hypothetical protein
MWLADSDDVILLELNLIACVQLGHNRWPISQGA